GGFRERGEHTVRNLLDIEQVGAGRLRLSPSPARAQERLLENRCPRKDSAEAAAEEVAARMMMVMVAHGVRQHTPTGDCETVSVGRYAWRATSAYGTGATVARISICT